jgi:multidrug efflux pump subunit AcrA (membrane-fusion protein)
VKKTRNHRMVGVASALLLAAGVVTVVSRATSNAGEPVPAPPDVVVAPVQQKDIPIEREWIGTLDGMVNAAIKAQVTGYLQAQRYAEGSFVHKGQLLFEVDSRPFQAAADQATGQLAQARAQLSQAQAGLAQAESQLASAEANQRKAQLDEDRYVPLRSRRPLHSRSWTTRARIINP